jgi:DNA helicase II / ATP-dependent DNA helicase PcrA
VNQFIIEEQNQLDKTVKLIDELIEDKSKKVKIPPKSHVESQLHHNQMKELRKLEDSIRSPYFGRLDFEDEFDKDTIYIGKKGIDYESELVVVDWRTELGKLYNAFQGIQTEFILGEDSTKNITIHGKRGINIQDGKVINVSNIGRTEIIEDEAGNKVKYMDEYLNEILTHTGDSHQLRDIVASIQSEQDEIVRLPLKDTIIVQGAAGSGKSTIALHRISYLLYQFNETLKPDKVLVLAPNEMFLSYIQEIVPEIEIEGIEQRTFYDWASHYFTDVRDISELHDDYVKVFAASDTDDLIQVSKYKGSLWFKKLLDEMVVYIGETMIPHGDITIDANTILTKEEIDIFYKSKTYLPLNIRMREMKAYIQDWSKRQIRLQKERIAGEFEDAYQKWIVTLPQGDERKRVYEALEDAKDLRLKQYQEKVSKEIGTYVRKMDEIPALKMYKSVFQKRVFDTFEPEIDEGLLSLLLKNGREVKKANFSYEDIAPLIYLDAKINGKKLEYDHLVIDEAQDYSPFQLAIMKDYAKSMTILGDMAQGIFSFYGLDSWEEIGSYVFKENEMKQLNLQTSYRSTKQIMDLANRVLINSSYDFPLVIPVNRQGAEPKVKNVGSASDLYDEIQSSLRYFNQAGHSKIAIITNNRESAIDMSEALEGRGIDDIAVITGGNQELKSKIVIIPSFLVKGLEFDAVIIDDVSERTYRDETLHAKLLYMTITRSHHDLHMYYRGELSPLLEFRDPDAPPKPRASFAEWLTTSITNPDIEPQVEETKYVDADETLILFEDEEKQQTTEYFRDDRERVTDFDAWLKVWRRWADHQKSQQ